MNCLRCGADLAKIPVVRGIADCAKIFVFVGNRWRVFRGDSCQLHAERGVRYRRDDAAERWWTRYDAAYYDRLPVLPHARIKA